MLTENNDIAVNQLQGLGERSDATKPRIYRNMKLTIENFSDLVESKFKESGLSQKKFSENLGISRGTLNNIFSREKLPDVNTLMKICSTFNYTAYLIEDKKTKDFLKDFK